MTVKTIFNDQGQTVQIIRIDQDNISDTLKPGVYTLEMSMRGPYLAKVSDRYSVPDVLYGKAEVNAKRAVNAFQQREQSTGVLLSGLKGAGKTMTATIMGNMVIDLGLPVIEIKSPIEPEIVEYVLNAVGQCAAVIDEFGKLYSIGQDNSSNTEDKGATTAAMLSLFAGTSTSKRLMILTENNTDKINTFMLDRPGRVLYHFRHNNLDPEVIQGIGEDKNIPKEFVDDVVNACFMSPSASFDVVNAVFEEYLRTPGSFSEVVHGMNVPMSSDTYRYAKLLSAKVSYTVNDDKVQSFDVTDLISDTYIVIKNGAFALSTTRTNCQTLSDQVKKIIETSNNNDLYVPDSSDIQFLIGQRFFSKHLKSQKDGLLQYGRPEGTQVRLELMPPDWEPPKTQYIH